MTKKSQNDRCKEIKDKTGVNRMVNDPDDFNFLLSIFNMHPEWDLKSQGMRIIAISVRKSPDHPTTCFYITREDGAETDISYRACINPVTNKANVKRACREAERPRKEEFKKTVRLPYKYIFNGERRIIESFHELEADHYDLEFDDVVELWVAQNGGYDHLATFINPTEDRTSITYFTDVELAKSFAQFCRQHSHLRPMTKRDNISRSKDALIVPVNE